MFGIGLGKKILRSNIFTRSLQMNNFFICKILSFLHFQNKAVVCENTRLMELEGLRKHLRLLRLKQRIMKCTGGTNCGDSW